MSPAYSIFNDPAFATLDYLAKRMLTSFGEAARADVRSVPINVWEDHDNFYVQALVPGLSPDQLSLTAHGSSIRISGDLPVFERENARAVWCEYGPTRFQREVTLSAEIDPDAIQAKLENGVLWITAPKTDAARTRVIPLTAGQQPKQLTAR
jgi:HSP20 family protein